MPIREPEASSSRHAVELHQPRYCLHLFDRDCAMTEQIVADGTEMGFHSLGGTVGIARLKGFKNFAVMTAI